MLTPADHQLLFAAWTMVKVIIGWQDTPESPPLLVGEAHEMKIMVCGDAVCFLAQERWQGQRDANLPSELHTTMITHRIAAIVISGNDVWMLRRKDGATGDDIRDTEQIQLNRDNHNLYHPPEWGKLGKELIDSSPGLRYIRLSWMKWLADSVRENRLKPTKYLPAVFLRWNYNDDQIVFDFFEEYQLIKDGRHIPAKLAGWVGGVVIWKQRWSGRSEQEVTSKLRPARNHTRKKLRQTFISLKDKLLSLVHEQNSKPAATSCDFSDGMVFFCNLCYQDMDEKDIKLAEGLSCSKHVVCRRCHQQYLTERLTLFPGFLPTCTDLSCRYRYSPDDLIAILGLDEMQRLYHGASDMLEVEPTFEYLRCPGCNQQINPDFMDPYSCSAGMLICPYCEVSIFTEDIQHAATPTFMTMRAVDRSRLYQNGICYEDAAGQAYTSTKEAEDRKVFTEKVCESCIEPLTLFDINLGLQLGCGEQHTICASCYRRYCEEEIKANRKPTCPAFNCTTEFDENDLELITRDHLLVETYAWKTAERLALNDQEFFQCPRPDCGYIGLNPVSQSRRQQVTCPKCKFQHTFYSREADADQKPFMRLMQDKDNCQETRQYLRQQIKQGKVKPCPECKVLVAHNTGCARMVCQLCRHMFCWVCLNNWGQQSEGYRLHSECKIDTGTTKYHVRQVDMPDELK